MNYSLKTDKGIMRSTNQDACFVDSPGENCCFALVCDGMGGARAGDFASSMAVEIISDRIMNAWREKLTPTSLENMLTSAISAANICIYDEAAADIAKKGMGTTVVAAAVINNECVIAHAGDSRAYLIGRENIRLTHDHSYVQTLIDNGIITELEAEKHPKKNYITRALGVSEHIEIDFNRTELGKGEKLLLCSDGLTNFVPEKDIFETVLSNDCHNGTDRLISLANKNGGGDNISAVIISL